MTFSLLRASSSSPILSLTPASSKQQQNKEVRGGVELRFWRGVKRVRSSLFFPSSSERRFVLRSWTYVPYTHYYHNSRRGEGEKRKKVTKGERRSTGKRKTLRTQPRTVCSLPPPSSSSSTALAFPPLGQVRKIELTNLPRTC